MFYNLTVSYPEEQELEEAETRAGVCLPRGVVRLREEPIICWVRLGANGQAIDDKLNQDIQRGLKIVLAQAEVFNCKLDRGIAINVRRSARPERQPYLACGKETSTDWEVWRIIDQVPDLALQNCVIILPFGLRAHVDTSFASFVTTPSYTVEIIGSRIISNPGSPNKLPVAIDGMLNMQNIRPDGFDLFVLIAVQPFTQGGLPNLGDEKEFLQLFSDWNIHWMGVEG